MSARDEYMTTRIRCCATNLGAQRRRTDTATESRRAASFLGTLLTRHGHVDFIEEKRCSLALPLALTTLQYLL